MSNRGKAPSSSSRASSSTQQESQQKSSRFNRVRVSDLLNDDSQAEPASSRSRASSSGRQSTTASGSGRRGSGSGIDPHSDASIQCVDCKRVFGSPELLRSHRKRIHPAPTSFVCEVCGLSYADTGNLRKHVRSLRALCFLVQDKLLHKSYSDTWTSI